MNQKGQLYKKMIQQKLREFFVDPLVKFCVSDRSETQASFLSSGCDLFGEVSQNDGCKFAGGLGDQGIEKNSPYFPYQGY